MGEDCIAGPYRYRLGASTVPPAFIGKTAESRRQPRGDLRQGGVRAQRYVTVRLGRFAVSDASLEKMRSTLPASRFASTMP